MCPPRFRLRTLMIAVAVLAILMGGSIAAMRMSQLAEKYRWRSNQFARAEAGYRGIANKAVALQKTMRGEYKIIKTCKIIYLIEGHEVLRKRVTEDAYYFEAMATYCAVMKRKYLRAASRPWESLPVDPREPRRPPIFRPPPSLPPGLLQGNNP